MDNFKHIYDYGEITHPTTTETRESDWKITEEQITNATKKLKNKQAPETDAVS